VKWRLVNTKQITFLKGLSFLHIGGKAVIIPFLPLYLYYHDFSSIEIGTIMGVAPLISIIAQPMVGYLSDKYNTIKNILLLLYVSVIGASFGIFYSDQFWIVFVSFLLFHFALSPCTPLIDSMTVKSLGKNRGEYGKIRLWGSLGFALIASISGPILNWIGIDKIYILFWITVLATIVLISFLKDQNQAAEPVNLKAVKEVLNNRYFMVFLLLCLMVMVPHRMNDTMLVLHLEHLGAATMMIGLAWALSAFSEVPVFYFLTKHIMKYDFLFLLGVVASLYSVRWILYGLIDSPFLITILQLSQGITFGLFWLVALQTAISVIPNHLRGTGQALITSVSFGIGGAIGGTGGGWIFDQFGSSAMYFLMAVMTFTASLVIFAVYRTARQKENTVKGAG
jgi:PPP family 3-phenylpropionic acid transporter